MFATRMQVRAPLVANRSRRAARIVPTAVIDDVREIIAEQLGFEVDQVMADSSFEEDLKADSLDTVEIMMALEEKFDITIEGAETESIKKVSDVSIIIEKIVRLPTQSGEIVPTPAAKEEAKDA